jgi:hypothetical protein
MTETTPEPWVFGTWGILNEDRAAQQRREPYWTLLPYNGVSGSFCRGPFGRKAMEPETVIHACGYETEGIDFDDDFLKLLLEKLNG